MANAKIGNFIGNPIKSNIIHISNLKHLFKYDFFEHINIAIFTSTPTSQYLALMSFQRTNNVN